MKKENELFRVPRTMAHGPDNNFLKIGLYYLKINLQVEIKTNEMDTTVDKIINEIFTRNKDYSHTIQNAFEAKKVRNEKLLMLKNGFNKEIFYLPEGHKDRNKTFFYDFAFGYEARLAGTGLRERQFKSVFENQNFKQIIEYIYPQIVGPKKWNFDNRDELLDFCNRLFNYKIPNYKEALPIRLASYFYPNHFIPIFKLDHLKNICIDFGFNSNPNKKGQKLFEYNSFIFSKLGNLPYDPYVKLYIISLVHYTIELYKRLRSGESYNEILVGYKKEWIRNLVTEGDGILKKISDLQ